MSIHELPGDLVLKTSPTASMLYTVFGVISLSNQELLSAARQIIVAIQDAGDAELHESYTLDEHDEKMLNVLTDGVGTVVEEAPKKKRGRPKKSEAATVIDQVVAQAAEEKAEPEPDVIVNLGGTAYAGELKGDDGVQAVVTYEADTKATGLVVTDVANVEPLGPYDATLQETLIKRFPLGHHVKVNGEVGVVTKHFDGSHKCQVDVVAGVRVVDMRELGDAPTHVAHPDVTSKVMSGTYGNDFGVALTGVPMLLLDDATGFVKAMGVEDSEAKKLCLTLVNGNGFVNTQAMAVSLALHFAEVNKQAIEIEVKPVIDPPLTPEEVALVRQEVKAAGLTPAQAKDLCQRHFRKESATLLTQAEMKKFLGEVVPTFVEMQGAEDF